MTPDHTTSISAVGVVFRGGPNWDFDLLVYHNAHAAVPIEPGLLTEHGIRQLHMDFGSGQWLSNKPGPTLAPPGHWTHRARSDIVATLDHSGRGWSSSWYTPAAAGTSG